MSAGPNGSNGRAPGARPCPICGKPADALRRPFCSKRCADVDLNRWLTGQYAVPVVEDDDLPDPDDPDLTGR